jgi:hypothetical protein
MVYSSQLSVGTPIAGEGYELDAIAAVVGGGTSLFGGSGSVFRTFVGTLFIGVLANILNLAGMDPFVQQLAKGALIVIAVFIMNQAVGVKIQLSNNLYTSRSDDVSVMLKTPNILLLGFPGFNRHFDLGEPTANIYDLVNLAKSMVYRCRR